MCVFSLINPNVPHLPETNLNVFLLRGSGLIIHLIFEHGLLMAAAARVKTNSVNNRFLKPW